MEVNMEEERFMVRISLADGIRQYRASKRGHSWIDTYSGKKIDFMDIRSESICIEDIAIGLANACRFAGQIHRFYSVAEHSVLVSKYVEARMGYHLPGVIESALMHDAAEAYIGDVTTPLKNLCPGFKMIENGIEAAIHSRFGLSVPFSHAMIKEADFRMFEIERDTFRDVPESERKRRLPEGLEIRCLTPDVARREFLERFESLGIQASTPVSDLASVSW
jgi:hypothetical protein